MEKLNIVSILLDQLKVKLVEHMELNNMFNTELNKIKLELYEKTSK